MEIPIKGMDCVGCASNVQKALAGLQGIHSVDVFLNSEKALIHFKEAPLELNTIRRIVEKAGYSVPDVETEVATPIFKP
jgi:P-type Cu+ transporter